MTESGINQDKTSQEQEVKLIIGENENNLEEYFKYARKKSKTTTTPLPEPFTETLNKAYTPLLEEIGKIRRPLEANLKNAQTEGDKKTAFEKLVTVVQPCIDKFREKQKKISEALISLAKDYPDQVAQAVHNLGRTTERCCDTYSILQNTLKENPLSENLDYYKACVDRHTFVTLYGQNDYATMSPEKRQLLEHFAFNEQYHGKTYEQDARKFIEEGQSSTQKMSEPVQTEDITPKPAQKTDSKVEYAAENKSEEKNETTPDGKVSIDKVRKYFSTLKLDHNEEKITHFKDLNPAERKLARQIRGVRNFARGEAKKLNLSSKDADALITKRTMAFITKVVNAQAESKMLHVDTGKSSVKDEIGKLQTAVNDYDKRVINAINANKGR